MKSKPQKCIPHVQTLEPLNFLSLLIEKLHLTCMLHFKSAKFAPV